MDYKLKQFCQKKVHKYPDPLTHEQKSNQEDSCLSSRQHHHDLDFGDRGDRLSFFVQPTARDELTCAGLGEEEGAVQCATAADTSESQCLLRPNCPPPLLLVSMLVLLLLPQSPQAL